MNGLHQYILSEIKKNPTLAVRKLAESVPLGANSKSLIGAAIKALQFEGYLSIQKKGRVTIKKLTPKGEEAIKC